MTHNNRHARRKIPSESHAAGSLTTSPDVVVSADDSIQSAIDSARAGDRIRIEPGTYTEQVVVDEDVTLVGAGPEETTIRCPPTLDGQFPDLEGEVRPVVALQSDGASLRNLTVDGNEQGRRNETFVGIGSCDASVYVGDVAVTGIAGEPGHGVGILAYVSDDADLLTYVERCAVRGYGQHGIVGHGRGNDLHVSDCVITGQGPTETHPRNGILLRDVAKATIIGNTITRNYCTGSDIATGIVSLRSVDIFAAWNVLEGNNSGFSAESSGDIVARQNNIRGNGTGVINHGARTFDATNNWWGSADGPSESDTWASGASDVETGADPDGDGDAVYNVNWDPYSTSPFNLGVAGPSSNTSFPPDQDSHSGREER
jgi:hypothetical protein